MYKILILISLLISGILLVEKPVIEVTPLPKLFKGVLPSPTSISVNTSSNIEGKTTELALMAFRERNKTSVVIKKSAKPPKPTVTPLSASTPLPTATYFPVSPPIPEIIYVTPSPTPITHVEQAPQVVYIPTYQPTPTPQVVYITPSVSPSPTPSPTPTPVSITLTTKEWVLPSDLYDAITLSEPTNEVKSITIEAYAIQYPNVSGTPDPIWGTETKEGLSNWPIYLSLYSRDGGGIVFEDVLMTSNPMTIPINKPFGTKARILSTVGCKSYPDECYPTPQLVFKILSIDGASVVRN